MDPGERSSQTESVRGQTLSRAGWLTTAAAAAVAIVATVLFPRSGGDRPTIAALALIATVIAAAMTAAMYAIVRRELRLPARIAASFAAAFGLIAIVKFVLAPHGLYEVNAVRALEDAFGTVADPTGAALTAAAVFGLYAGVYAVLYRVWQRRAPGRTRRVRRTVAIVFLIGIPLVVLTGAWIILFFVLLAPLQYLDFVFTSGVAGLIALVLAIAATLIGWTFRRIALSPQLLADVGAVISLFWLGFAFLALYHVLWIAYVLVLASIWPLRTVVPK
jgi:hypothetical protein